MRVRTANDGLMTILGIEEKFEFVLANYVAYESELLRLALDRVVWGEPDWPRYRSARHDVNLRLVNLLSTTRLYLDHVVHDVKAIFGETSPEVEKVCTSKRREYDSKLGYRVCEALRNHALHQDVPVHQLSFPFVIGDIGNMSTYRHSAMPLLDVERLSANKNFKRTVLEELKLTYGNSVSLTPLVRGYVAGISRIHAVVRRVTDHVVAGWDEAINDIRERATTAFEGDISQLAIFIEYPEERTARGFLVDQVWAERRALRAKNQRLDDLGYKYVSSEQPEIAHKRPAG